MPLYSPRACIRVQRRHIYAVLHKKQTRKTHASYQKTKTWNILQHIFWRTYHIVRSLGAGFVTYVWKAIFWFNLDTEEQKDTNAKPCFFFPAPPLQKLHAYLPYILKYSTLLGLAVKMWQIAPGSGCYREVVDRHLRTANVNDCLYETVFRLHSAMRNICRGKFNMVYM